MRTLDTVIERLRAEFMEMPGLRLTGKQVQRLCGVEPTVCDVVLAALVDERFLCAKSDGTYVRVSDGNLLRRRAAKADLHLTAHDALHAGRAKEQRASRESLHMCFTIGLLRISL